MKKIELTIDAETQEFLEEVNYEPTGEYRPVREGEYYENGEEGITEWTHKTQSPFATLILRKKPLPPWNGNFEIPNNWWICRDDQSKCYWISKEEPIPTTPPSPPTGETISPWTFTGKAHHIGYRAWETIGGYQFQPNLPLSQQKLKIRHQSTEKQNSIQYLKTQILDMSLEDHNRIQAAKKLVELLS